MHMVHTHTQEYKYTKNKITKYHKALKIINNIDFKALKKLKKKGKYHVLSHRWNPDFRYKFDSNNKTH